MHTIAVTCQKGGNARTTTAVNLAAALCQRGALDNALKRHPEEQATGRPLG